MLNSLEKQAFFSEEEIAKLRALGLWQDSRKSPARLAFAGLLLAPIMQIVVRDSATTSAEFETTMKYVHQLEREFVLASRDDIESIGTEMGLLPMLKGTWDNTKFVEARALLAETLNRLSESDAQAVRNAISRAALAVARAGSPHMISMHILDKDEREMIQELIHELQLEKSSEGMQLMEKTSD